MTKVMRLILCCVALVLLVGQSDAQVEVKAAGGLLLDPSRWGGHVSVDIPIGDTYPTFLSPFVEFYRKSGINAIPVGLNLLYKAPFSEEYGMIYFGAGGGLYRVSGTITLRDLSGNPIATIKDTSNQGMITVLGGLQIDFSDAVGVFAQGRWFRAFASGAKYEVAAMVGLNFKLGER